MARTLLRRAGTSGSFTFALILLTSAFAPTLHAQEKPYFVTYSQDLEEPGNLEIETKTALAQPEDSGRYGATAASLNTAFAPGGQRNSTSTAKPRQDSTIFTGFRLENRVRPLMREHLINPVLYVEYENISGADKTLLEVVGHDGQSDLAVPNDEARQETQHEAELKLILSQI